MGRNQNPLARFQNAAIRARLPRGNSRSRPAHHERDAGNRCIDQKIFFRHAFRDCKDASTNSGRIGCKVPAEQSLTNCVAGSV